MAKHSQHQQGASAHDAKSKSGGSQSVVELCEISPSGLVFWSRRRFEIGAEIQVRIHRSALPAGAQHSGASPGKWVTLKGFVVACPKHRRMNGSSGFHVSLLIEHVPEDVAENTPFRSKMRWLRSPLPWMRRFGLN
jgi:hypothetical protein